MTRTYGKVFFIDIKDGGLKRLLTLGDIYRPPRNINENYETFIEEITHILSNLSNHNRECVYDGDFNINLLKITEKEAFSKFYDTIIMNSFIFTKNISYTILKYKWPSN